MEGNWQEARRLQLVVLREGEMVDKSGNVVEVMEDNQDRDNRKRRNSGGSSSPQNARRKRGRVVAGDFGETVE